MTKRYTLSETELKDALNSLPDWQINDGYLHRQYNFPTFARAMGWMMSAAIECDKLDHHPEWSNEYNRVSVNLVTHDLGNTISSWDILLAQKFDALT